MLKAIRSSSPGVLITRILVAAIAVFASYNPTGNSIFHWVRDHEDPTNAWVVLASIVIVLVHIALLIAAWKALGKVGTVIMLVLFAALAYLAFQEDWVSAGNNASLQWLGLILYSAFLGIGLAGAILWRRATGQIVTDEAGDVD